MIKYKVKDAAADLGVSNKEIIEILEKHCGVTKKTMTTLEESELDVIFDVITKKTRLKTLMNTLRHATTSLTTKASHSRKISPQSRMQRLTIRKKRPIKTTKSLTTRMQSLHQNRKRLKLLRKRALRSLLPASESN